MSDPVITIENLSKRYIIGHQHTRNEGLRHVIEDAMRSPLAWWRARQAQKNAQRADFWALKDVSFQIKQGEVVGIIGRNGAGKSTLLKILSRITQPTKGRIRLNGRVACLLEVGTGFHSELTGRENIFLNGAILGMSRAEIVRKFDEIVEFSEVEKFLDTPVKRYSSGMYVRLAFAVAAHLESEILIVDEVLAVGDAGFQQKCLGKIQDLAQKSGRTVLFVSHQLSAVRRLCTGGVLLETGRVVYSGPAEPVIARYLDLTTQKRPASAEGAHVLFTALFDSNDPRDFCLTKLELLDVFSSPKPVVSTWDTVVFRIHFHARRHFISGAVELRIRTPDGLNILRFSTQPDDNLDLPFRPGPQWIDCRVDELPLAAGRYVIAAGLTIPQISNLWWSDDVAIMEVHPKDVFASGLPPNTARALVASKHAWQGNTATAVTPASRMQL
jgi:lipopolysaccharide transport system ATP-binding protein